eukprot:TRINITY_DN366_c3_g1_i1.p1 TRINITY_DN366_c3_g1~~TRINITY_DN366_c3_g1_i1.p1  ORF type:complete len:322 (+),score=85.58 TRINITY_DN366_c3_g1_i1:71-967(+)
MPLSYQGRQAAHPPSAPSDDVRTLIAENRRLQDASKENERLRREISEVTRQKEQLETALEECMDLLLQVGGKNTSTTAGEVELNRALELLAEKKNELNQVQQEVSSIMQQHADERNSMHRTITQLSQKNEELSNVIKKQQSDLELSRVRSEELLSLDAELHNRMEDLQHAVTQKEQDSVNARVQAANTTSALVEERKKREEDAQQIRKLQSQIQILRRNCPNSSQGFNQLAADAMRIKQDLNNRRSVSEKWSLSPDHATPTPPRKSPLVSTPGKLSAPLLPSPVPRMPLAADTSVEAV